MKNTIVFFFALLLFSNVNAQTTDSISVKFESDNFTVIHNHSKNSFQITGKNNNVSFANLKYVEAVGDSFQVINEKNEIFFINTTTLEKQEEAGNLFWLCGTVPHYTLAVVEKEDSFLITIDETFYDMVGENPAEEVMKISKDKADKILFINGKSTFDYTSNFSYSSTIINPQTVILVKDGKYSIAGEEGIQYDAVDFTGYSPTLKYTINDLIGFHNITDAKYKEVSNFQDNLARVTTVEGKEIIIDKQGQEY